MLTGSPVELPYSEWPREKPQQRRAMLLTRGRVGRPRRQMAEVTGTANSAEEVQRFEALTGGENALRRYGLSLECLAAGRRRWGSFKR